jgi:hypothetical protein
MYAIVKRKLAFRNVKAGGKFFTVNPAPGPQQIPSWIKDTEEFKLASAGQNPVIQEVVVKAPPVPATFKTQAQQKAEADKKAADAKAVADKKKADDAAAAAAKATGIGATK